MGNNFGDMFVTNRKGPTLHDFALLLIICWTRIIWWKHIIWWTHIIWRMRIIWWTCIMMMSTHHMMYNHHKSATFWGKKCMMDRHHISQLISHQWHFPIKENYHQGYIKVVNCPTRFSTTEQKNIAWGCANIKQVLLQTQTFKGSFRTKFLLPPEWHQSNILIYQKILLANG